MMLVTTANLIPNEIDTIWYRTMGAYATDVDFTPDNKYVVAWANGIELWEVQEGRKDFYIPSETTGDFNYNQDYLVIVQDSTPKLFKWRTREIVEGFEKENQHFGRIKTAKSKNEFMATLGHYPKTIFFWDINQKSILDSFEITKEYKADGYKWERFIREYHYAGINDEYFIIRVSDNNRNTDFLHPDDEIDKYSYLIYDRNTKELVDSLFAFNITKNNYSHVDKLVIMNNRDHLAWNNEGGIISFYTINKRIFYNKLVFDERDHIEATQISLSKDDEFSIITSQYSTFLKIFGNSSKALLHKYDKGSFQNASFSNNNQYLVANIGSWLILFPSHITQTNINEEHNDFSFNLSPNPADSHISINFGAEAGSSYDLSLIDLSGNEVGKVDNGIIDTEKYSIDYDISQLPAGVYFVRLDLAGEVITRKFVKE